MNSFTVINPAELGDRPLRQRAKRGDDPIAIAEKITSKTAIDSRRPVEGVYQLGRMLHASRNSGSASFHRIPNIRLSAPRAFCSGRVRSNSSSINLLTRSCVRI